MREMRVYILRDSWLGVPVKYLQNKKLAYREARELKRVGVDVRVSRPIPPQTLGLPTGRRELGLELEKLNSSLQASWEALP
jgi:hypothetical protein